jgi:hypothetical protein
MIPPILCEKSCKVVEEERTGVPATDGGGCAIFARHILAEALS